MRRALTVAAGTLVAVTLAVAPAIADSTVVVRGTAFPVGGEAQLSYVGCSGLYDRGIESLQPYLSLGPGTAPAGERSVEYDLGGGNAIGSLHYVSSMVATTVAGLSVYAADGATGVAYAGYQQPTDSGTSLVWFGRSALQAAAGTWQQVDATQLTYTWTKYDMATHQPVPTDDATGPAGVIEFMTAHGGDGAGFYTIGFGCDGNTFDMDAWRISGPSGVTTYDLEGLTTTSTISGSAKSITAGDPATIHGALRDGGGSKLFRATMILEARSFGSGDFQTVEISDAAGAIDPNIIVAPTTQTVYRWRFADRPLAEGSMSEPFTIDVATAVTAALTTTGTSTGADSEGNGDGDGGAGQSIIGTTTPAKAGVEATLWQITPKGAVRVDTRRTAADGTYIFKVAETGAGRYYVSVPAASGNMAGTSPTVQVEPAPQTPIR